VVLITTYLKISRVKSYSKMPYCSKKYFISAKPPTIITVLTVLINMGLQFFPDSTHFDIVLFLTAVLVFVFIVSYTVLLSEITCNWLPYCCQVVFFNNITELLTLIMAATCSMHSANVIHNFNTMCEYYQPFTSYAHLHVVRKASRWFPTSDN
jgi:hypothetical protein